MLESLIDGRLKLAVRNILHVVCSLVQNAIKALTDCPANAFALSGGFSAQGSVTESYRLADGSGWLVTQSSGNTDSLKVYAYCVATS